MPLPTIMISGSSMPYPRLLVIIFAMAVLISSSTGQSQSSAPQSAASQQPASTPPTQSNADAQGREPLVRVRTDEVNVVFTVVDKHGRLFRNLTQGRSRIFATRWLRPRTVKL